jgi:hypothetical protein
VREALDQAHPEWIDHEHEDDRYRARLLPQRYQRRRSGGEQRARRQADQLLRIRPEENWFDGGKAVLDPDISSAAPPQTPERISKDRRMCAPVLLGPGHQYADPAHPLGLLCVPGKRPCRRPAENSDKSAPPWSLHRHYSPPPVFIVLRR